MKFIETSAKTAFNVGDSFINMSSDIIKNLQAKEIKQTPDSSETNRVDLSNTRGKDLSKKNCC